MRKLLRALKLFIKVDWIDTFRINSMLPFRQGKHFPILLFNAHLRAKKGSIILNCDDSQCRFGIIKLGIAHSPNICSNSGVNLHVKNGRLIFNGAGIIGNGSSIECLNNETSGGYGTIELGKNFGVTGNFHVASKSYIKIGENLSCSWNVSIYDTDFHTYMDPSANIVCDISEDIYIGDNVWLCQSVTILKGSIIPNWVTIGACSLVNKDYSKVPDYTIIAGVPARITSKSIKRMDIERISQSSSWQITSGLKLFDVLPL